MNITQKFKRLVLTLPLLLFFINPAFAFMTVQEYEKLKENNSTRIMMLYLSALGEGFNISNIAIEKRGDKPLFCKPKTFQLNEVNFISMIDKELAPIPKELKAEVSIDMILYLALIDTFPCPK